MSEHVAVGQAALDFELTDKALFTSTHFSGNMADIPKNEDVLRLLDQLNREA